jgi:hypothetical protein
MWTFTLRECVDVKAGARLWSRLWSDVLRRIGFRGVRFYELHRGGHGLHVHFLTPVFVPVDDVRDAIRSHLAGEAWGAGFGVDVQEVGEGGILYALKYVRKARRCLALKGVRLWARCGVQGERCKDIRIDTARGRVAREYIRVFGHSWRNLQASTELWARYGERGAMVALRVMESEKDRMESDRVRRARGEAMGGVLAFWGALP